MKDLKTYISEAIKPPRLSAKNRDLWATKPLDEKEVMKWLNDNCWFKGKVDIVNGKINVNGNVVVYDKVECFLYPFGEVTGFFDCSNCKKLKSLKNTPQKVGRYFNCSECNSLTSLEGAPKEVGIDFWCCECGKQFTEDDVKKVCNVKGEIYV